MTETALTWTAPGEIKPCPIVHTFTYRGRLYFVVVTRDGPGEPILAVRQPDQFFAPDDVGKFFGD